MLKHNLRAGPPRFNRFSAGVLIVMALLLPAVLFGARGALKSVSNDPRQWLPRDFAETDKHLEFQQRFGIDEGAVVSWPGCTLDNPQVEQLAAALEASELDGERLFSRVITGPRVLRQMTDEPLDIAETEALRRLTGLLIGPDGKTTCIVLEISEQGQENRAATVEHIVRTAGQDPYGLSPEDLRMGGPTVDAAAIDSESRRLLFQLAGLSAMVSLLIAGLQLRSLRLAMILLIGAGYCTCLSLAVLFYTGGRMNLLMTMLPPLIYVLTISSGVHLINYYRDAIREGGLDGAPNRAIAGGWMPCLLAAGTTAVGLASLAFSKIVPIGEFGVYSAVGVLLSVLVLLVYLPAVLRFFPVVGRDQVPREKQDESSANHVTVHRPITVRYLAGITRFHAVVTVLCLAVMALAGWGLTRITSTVRLQDRFVADSKIINDYTWLEKNLGPLVPLEVVVGFAAECPLKFHERMALVGRIQQRIDATPHAGASLSAVDFAVDLAPPNPAGRSWRDVADRKIYDRRVAQIQEKFAENHLLAEHDGQQFWRISVRANALGNLDYGLFTEVLRKGVDPILTDAADARVTVTYTGIIPLIYKAQRQLLDDLVRSFFAAFIAIAVVMIVVLRSFTAGLLAMIPNVFPAIIIFGGMGWLDIQVQIGSVMTASAALGIAVDDTIHFLTWYRRGLRSGQSRHAALGDSLQRCAGAMLLTTLICGAGLAVFGLSSFVPILHFAWLMVTLLLAAIIGDLVLLPAILAGPLGRMFGDRDARSEDL
ncbi:MAG: MMPL family transporter [Planctomycetes bacterium]|nr:MMPL family transporter [Planctomycetota bacterium]